MPGSMVEGYGFACVWDVWVLSQACRRTIESTKNRETDFPVAVRDPAIGVAQQQLAPPIRQSLIELAFT